MSNIWTRIRQLEGQTLYTAARQRPFRIDRVSNRLIFYTLGSTGNERSSLRETFEQIDNLGLKQHEITRGRVDEEITTADRFNTSYVHAILCAIDRAI